MNPGEIRVDVHQYSGGFVIIECVGIHNGVSLVISWPGLFSTRAGAWMEVEQGIHQRIYTIREAA